MRTRSWLTGVALAATITTALPYGGFIDREAQFDLTAASASAGWVKRPPVNLARSDPTS